MELLAPAGSMEALRAAVCTVRKDSAFCVFHSMVWLQR